MMPETPEGWYTDPNQPAQQRWWNGVQWTEHTAPLGQAPSATAEPSAPAQSSKLKIALIVGAVILAIALVTRSLGVILMLAGFALFFIAIYAIVRGSEVLPRALARNRVGRSRRRTRAGVCRLGGERRAGWAGLEQLGRLIEHRRPQAFRGTRDI